jgi:hypothetical protein
MKDVKCLDDLPGLFHIALQIAWLIKDSKTETLREIYKMLRHLYGFQFTDGEFTEKFKVIRHKTFFNDGW